MKLSRETAFVGRKYAQFNAMRRQSQICGICRIKMKRVGAHSLSVHYSVSILTVKHKLVKKKVNE